MATSNANTNADCHTEKAEMMASPCGHRFCERCSPTVFEMDTCPLCHAQIDAVVVGFVDRCPFNEAVLAACRDVLSSEKNKK
ncbi:hypothetical protein AC249_AIPGENE12200, partial [Exaiptasia diaphana]